MYNINKTKKVKNKNPDNVESVVIFLVGSMKRSQNKLEKILRKECLECYSVTWEEIAHIKEGVFVLFTPPKKEYEKQVMKVLMETNSYIISLFKSYNGYKSIEKHFLCLPTMYKTNIIKNIILFTLSKKNQELKLRKFRRELQKRNEEWINELTLANELQKSLLPRDILTNLPINFVHRYLPHAYIGGDFYDIIKFNMNKIGIIIADVSGHGAAAAFITAMLKSALDHFALQESSPAHLLLRLNNEFYNQIREHYITAFYAIIDIEKMECTYCNAGHPRQLLLHKNGSIEELKTSGFFIGMFRDIILEERAIPVFPGDKFIFYTDGVIDVKNEKTESFGLHNLKKYLKKGINKDISHLSNYIINKVILHMKENLFPDDLTLLIAEMIEDI